MQYASLILCLVLVDGIDRKSIRQYIRYQYGDIIVITINNSKLFNNYINLSWLSIEHDIIGEGSQVSTNQKRESTVSSILID